jgi:hypothetical protein
LAGSARSLEGSAAAGDSGSSSVWSKSKSSGSSKAC